MNMGPEKLIEFIPEKRLNIKFSFVDDDDDHVLVQYV